jgi:hypothetical protein
LHVRQHMGIGVQSYRSGRVPEHPGHATLGLTWSCAWSQWTCAPYSGPYIAHSVCGG